MKLAQKLAVNYLRARLNIMAVFSPRKAAASAYRIFCTPFYRSKKPLPPIFSKAERLSLEVKGHTVKGFKWNRGGTKRILVLHGFESSCTNFEAYIRGLIKKNYEVIAFDAPGHGASPGKTITLPLYVSMIESIYYKFGGIQGFIAHSFGGLALAHFMEKLIEVTGINLVFIAPATETSRAVDTFLRFLQLGQNVRDEFEKIITGIAGHPPEYYSIPRALEHTKAKVLWVHDNDDDITPIEDVKPLMDATHPNISFYITHGLGHRKIYRDERVLQRVLDFL